MILETLDIKQNDVFIYSENKFDFNRNFHLINKDDKFKKSVAIHFNDVCKYIYSSDPKTVVVYRLLTNLDSFQTEIIKYGVMVTINNAPEVIHFDPIFAVKELEEYIKSNNISDVRFRIQQVGLLSQISSFGRPNYSEVYAFDLEVAEAKWQNDKVFAELIFAFEEVDFDGINVANNFVKTKSGDEKPVQRFKKITVEDVKHDIIEEDKNFDAKKIKKLTYFPIPGSPRPQAESKEQSKIVNPMSESQKKTANAELPSKKEMTFTSFLKHVKQEPTTTKSGDEVAKQKGNLLELFKSSQPVHEYVVARGEKQIVLKLKSSPQK